MNPTVVNGAATFNQVGNVLTVTNSNGAIINWDKFSIKAGETTHFAQTSASSSVLNRVLNDPTAIYGTLSSNGRVWLVNPAGIMVGAGGRVDVAGFVASTLNISNENFLAGRNLFVNDGTAKDVINQGEITTPAGGSVYLIGSNVTNEGIITTPKGETILAAGVTVSLIDSALPGVKVDITGAAGNSTNLGTITAEAGRIGIAGVIVRNSGQLNASSVVNEGGRIFLRASKDAYVDGNGRIVTTGTKGGSVEVLGNRVAVMDNASIDASGVSGGGTIKVGGDYQGKNQDIQNANITYFGHNASLKADATGVGDGGTVIVWADDVTRAYGTISARGGASGGNGGFVETSGKRWLNFLATVDTSAPKGKTGILLLDPTDIEIVSGSALANGILSAGTGVFDCDPNPLSTIGWDTIQTQLNSTDVVIQTSSSSTGADFGGTIFVNGSPSGAPVPITHSYFDESGVFRSYPNTSGPTYNSANKLSLLAENAVDINAPFGNAGTGAITIVAGWDSVVSGGNPTPLTAPQTVAYTGATSHNINFTAVLATKGPLTLKATDTVDINAASSWAGIEMTTGTLDITANKLALTAGNSGSPGTQYGARIATNGDQYFSLGASGGLYLQGSNQAGGFGGSASIERFLGTTGGQNFTMNVAGGEISVVSGSGNGAIAPGLWSGDCFNGGCSGNFASISDRGGPGGGGQTIDFVNGGIITVVGGQAGSGNFAEIHSNGPQTIQSSPGNPLTINITGGTGGVFNGTNYLTNDAGIGSKVSQTINTFGGALTMIGGGDANTYGGAYLGAPVQNLSFGNVTLTGGASNTQDADGLGSPVAIGEKNSANVTMSVYSLTITGGLGTASPVGIGSLNGSASVVIASQNDVTIDSGNGGVGIGSIGAAVAAGAAGGVYIANGTSIETTSGGIQVYAKDNAAINGTLYANCGECGGVSITAGYSVAAGYGINGGNIHLGPNSSITGELVNLVARGGYAVNGNIVQEAGGLIVSTGSGYGTYSTTIAASGNVDLSGTILSSQDVNIVAGVDISCAAGNCTNSSGYASPIGGNAFIRNGAILAADRDINISANVGYGTYGNGNVTQFAGSSIIGDGNVSIVAGGSVSLGGIVASTTGTLMVQAGYQSNYFTDSTYGVTPYGGDITLASGSFLSGYGGATLYASNGTVNNGDITQAAGSTIHAGYSDITIVSAGDTTLNGTVSAGYRIFIGAGLDPLNSNNWTGIGGNVRFGAGSIVESRDGYDSDVITIVTHGGTRSLGDIVQAPGAQLTAAYGYVNVLAYGDARMDGTTSIYDASGYGIYVAAGAMNSSGLSSSFGAGYRAGSGNIVSIGVFDAIGGTVGVEAAGAILRSASNPNSINIAADTVSLTSFGGGSSGGIAISAFVEATSMISAEVVAGASYGGISIANFGAQPGTVSLIDNASYAGTGLGGRPMSIAFYNSGDLFVDANTTFSTANSGDMAITSGGNMNYISGLGSINGSLLLGADGNLAISTSLTTSGDLKLSAGGILDVDYSIGGYNIELGAPTININADVTATNNAALIAPLVGGTINLNAGVTAGGTWATRSSINGLEYSGIAIIAQDVIADGPSAYLNATSYTGDISGLVSGNITLDHGASFQAGNDIDLTLAGSASTLSLSNGSYFLTDYMTGIPATIKLEFTSRTSGGVMIDGKETTKTVVGGSGFFVVDYLLGTPATEELGGGLEIKYASTGVTTDICTISPDLCKLPPPNENPIDDDAPPPFSKPDKDKKASCEEGSFGCEENQANDGKKDEKPGEKKVAQCSL
ncbi:MAG: filamentous hemagglutinin N-terminal domain-containing protein [Sulfuritalea sp.]|nr:filamentous hemagglutinin N-terminal domain-containing protein [Sulfuritalea sp.]